MESSRQFVLMRERARCRTRRGDALWQSKGFVFGGTIVRRLGPRRARQGQNNLEFCKRGSVEMPASEGKTRPGVEDGRTNFGARVGPPWEIVTKLTVEPVG